MYTKLPIEEERFLRQVSANRFFREFLSLIPRPRRDNAALWLVRKLEGINMHRAWTSQVRIAHLPCLDSAPDRHRRATAAPPGHQPDL